MTIRRNAPVQSLTDAAVEAATETGQDPVSGAMNKLRAARNITPGKAKKKARDKARKKITFDWPEWLIDLITEMAGQEGDRMPANQLAAILTIEGLRAVKSGKLKIRDRKIPTRTPAFDWFLRVDDKEDL
jgi:hypothetical protein